MSITDQLNLDTLFVNKSRRIIQCKNSYERLLVYKFASENMLDAKKIEMKHLNGNTITTLKYRCQCKGYLTISECKYHCKDAYDKLKDQTLIETLVSEGDILSM